MQLKTSYVCYFLILYECVAAQEYNPPTLNSKIFTYPIAFSPLTSIQSCATGYNNYVVCSGSYNGNASSFFNTTTTGKTAVLWQAGANSSTTWSPFWIAGSSTNLDKDAIVTSNITQNRNLTSTGSYVTVGAKRWNLGYEDRIVFATSGDGSVSIFHYDWLTPLTTSRTQPRRVGLPAGISRVDMFSCLDSNGGTYAVNGNMIYWMPIVTPLSPNPATNSTPSGKVTQFDGTIKAITLMQDSSTLYVAEKSTNFSAINVWKLDVRSNELIPSSSRTLVFSVNATQWPFISTTGSNTVSGLAVHPQNSIVYLSFTDKDFAVAVDPKKNVSQYIKIKYSKLTSASFLDLDDNGNSMVAVGTFDSTVVMERLEFKGTLLAASASALSITLLPLVLWIFYL